jgi:hypothetical protein
MSETINHIIKKKTNVFNYSQNNCGDTCISINDITTIDLSDIDTVDNFTKDIYTQLIDVKNRQVLNSYPTLRMFYDRYNYDSLKYSINESSNYDYFDMDNFGKKVGSYWINLMEEVTPATTIWESTYVYRNTVFDQQKFEYKKTSLQIRSVNYVTNSSELTDSYGFEPLKCDNIDVQVEKLPNNRETQTPPLAFKLEDYAGTYRYGKTNGICIMNLTSSPNFFGKVSGDPDNKKGNSWDYFYNFH